MATLSRQGGDLKIEIGSTIKYLALSDIEVQIDGDLVYFQDGSSIDFNDVISPVVTSAEDLADNIGTFIYEYTTGA